MPTMPKLTNLDYYQMIQSVLLVVGLWKLLEKCGEKGYYALIPGYRYYKLGEIAGRERDGIACFVFEIARFLLRVAYPVIPDETSPEFFVALIILAVMLILVIYQIRVVSGLCFTFNRKKWWIILWIFAEWLMFLIWGIFKQFQPVNRGIDDDDNLLAGTNPFHVQYGSQDEAADTGLQVQLKERTVNDFGKKRYLLKDIYFTIPVNSLVLLLGGSGSGKTTLVNAVIGYEKANAVIRLNGENVYENYDQMKYKIGFVPQQDLLRQTDTVYNTLHDAAKLRLPVQVSRKKSKERIQEVMDVLGLTAGKSGLVSKKSGGQKKRISIGMELISDPDLFILDEPDSGLDGVIARELFEKLHDIAHQGNVVITITHTPDRVADLFDKVIVLARDSGRVGRLAFYGSPDEARKFFGKDTMEQIVMAVNKKEEGGEGRADEFIAKYAELQAGQLTQAEPQETEITEDEQ